MALSRGKQFENKFKEDWERCFPGSFDYRLVDQQSGYAGSSNPCDFINYDQPNLFLIETKSKQGNTFPWSDFPQYEKLHGYEEKNISGMNIYLIVWFIDHDKVLGVPIKTVTKMMQDGLKSINVKKLDFDKYPMLDLPSTKKRVFMDTDYRPLKGAEFKW